VNKNGTLLRFPEGGFQRIRIQVREDGVSVDQFVLSAVKYRTTRPGTAKNDTTILTETFRMRVTSGIMSSRNTWHGTNHL
jgi:hypothetical protein